LKDARPFYPPRDAVGNVIPHKIGLATWLKVAPYLPQLFPDRVPEEFWAQTIDEDGKPLITVSCPCGHDAELGFAGMADCECDRMFLHTGREVRCGRGFESEQPSEVVD
jgi:hypothetical protein